MNKSLKEQLKRIHTLSYGKEILSEGLLDSLFGKPDKKKADTVDPDVAEFFENLKSAVAGGGITQEQSGSMTSKKEVESVQIGLILLGYELPRYGVDGYFGPETAHAIEQFKTDKEVLNESADELRSIIKKFGHEEKGSELSSGGEMTQEMTKVVGDILKRFAEVKPGVTFRFTAGNDNYHKGTNSRHATGNAVDMVLDDGSSENRNAFLEVLRQYKNDNPTFSFIDEYTNPSRRATGPHFHLQIGGNSVAPAKTMVTATPEMITKMVELLKRKGIKSEDISQYTNLATKEISGIGQKLLADVDFKKGLNEISKRIKVDEPYIVKMMNHESGMVPNIKNSIGCVGLIQFCPDNKNGSTKKIGNKTYNLEELRSNTALQLQAIKEYWGNGYDNGRIKTPEDLYIYNFFPIAAGREDSFVLQTKNLSAELIARQNPIFNRTLGRPLNTPLTVGALKDFYRKTGMV